MVTHKYINVAIAILVAIATIFTAVFMLHPEKLGIVATSTEQSEPQYISEIFNKEEIMSINISVDEDEWKDMLENALNEEYISCDVTINGTTFYSVGIRPKGNSSLTQVASSDSDRFSFKFEFDRYKDGQTCFGLDKMVINNMQADTTYMKEYLSYDILNYIGVATPGYAFSNVTVNGQEWGCYLALEALEESYATRYFGADYGNLYKPEGNNMGGGAPRDKSSSGSGGTDLKYTDDELESYSTIFDCSVFDSTKEDNQRVVEALKHLSEGTELEKYIDVDSVIRYFAAHTVVVNLDSYICNLQHNYYLYEKDGQISILPWDYNLAFGGFQAGSATSAVNFPIDTPVASGIEMSERPLLAKLLEVEEYKALYHQYLEEIVEGYFESGLFESTIDQTDSLINEYVKNDETAFYTYEEYTASLPSLKTFGALRAQSIKGQLEGTIPSTREGQEADSSQLVDASSINLSDLGTQGGGGKGGEGGPTRQMSQAAEGQETQGGQMSQAAEGQETQGGQMPQAAEGQETQGGQMPQAAEGQQRQAPPEGEKQGGNGRPMGEGRPGGMGGQMPPGIDGNMSHEASLSQIYTKENLAMLGGYIGLVILGIIYVIKFKRRGI